MHVHDIVVCTCVCVFMHTHVYALYLSNRLWTNIGENEVLLLQNYVILGTDINNTYNNNIIIHMSKLLYIIIRGV